MFNSKIFEEAASRIGQMLPKGAMMLPQEIEKNMKALFSSALAKMDLVTREEFDIQKALLDATQDRLATLEQQVERLAKKDN
ncbi:Ubiquinone biosynthesis accessory factor UbiK [Gammaproteobacteria bacterium]